MLLTIRRLTTKSRQAARCVFKEIRPPIYVTDVSDRQQRYQGVCQISEGYNNSHLQTRDIGCSRDQVVRRLTA